MIILLDAEKAFNKIQWPFIIKTLSRLGTEGNFLNLKKNVTKNLKLMDETTEELNKWREIPCSWVRRLNIVKLSVLPNLICRFNTIQIKIPVSYFVNIYKLILKFT